MEPQRLLMRYIRNTGAANAILYALAQLDKPFYTELCHASELKSGTFATRMADLLDMEIIGRIQGGSRGPLRYADYHFVNTMFQFWVTSLCSQILRKLIAVKGNIFTIPLQNLR